MKTYYKTILIALFLLISATGILAQTKQAKLNQVELFKQFLGTWTGEVGKDTTITGVNEPFGTGIECNSQIITKGKILDSVKQLLGYDIRSDRFIIAELKKSSPVIEICSTWFTTEYAGELVLSQDSSDPEKATLMFKFEFKSPDLIVQTAFYNGKVIKAVTLTRIKK
jgi:hypothetical protein